MADKKLGKLHFVVNKEANGGEAVVIDTDIWTNGEEGKNNIGLDQKITLN